MLEQIERHESIKEIVIREGLNFPQEIDEGQETLAIEKVSQKAIPKRKRYDCWC